MIDGHAVHWSKCNVSADSRHAYAVHVYDGTSKWSEHNWLVISQHLVPDLQRGLVFKTKTKTSKIFQDQDFLVKTRTITHCQMM